MSQPPSRSPDSLTGASAEISALQLAERRGDGGTEGERDGWRRGREGGGSEREGQAEEEKGRRGRAKEMGGREGGEGNREGG